MHDADYESDTTQSIEDLMEDIHDTIFTINHSDDDDYSPAGGSSEESSIDSDGEHWDVVGRQEDKAAEEEARRIDAEAEAEHREQVASIHGMQDRWAQPYVDTTPTVPGTVALEDFTQQLRLSGPEVSGAVQLQRMLQAGVLNDGDLLSFPGTGTARRIGIISSGRLQDVTGAGLVPYDDPSLLLSAWVGSGADGWQLVVDGRGATLGQLRDGMGNRK